MDTVEQPVNVWRVLYELIQIFEEIELDDEESS